MCGRHRFRGPPEGDAKEHRAAHIDAQKKADVVAPSGVVRRVNREVLPHQQGRQGGGHQGSLPPRRCGSRRPAWGCRAGTPPSHGPNPGAPPTKPGWRFSPSLPSAAGAECWLRFGLAPAFACGITVPENRREASGLADGAATFSGLLHVCPGQSGQARATKSQARQMIKTSSTGVTPDPA